MQPAAVVDIIQKSADPPSGINQVVVLIEIYLFILERFHEALTLGIVVWVRFPAHADADLMTGERLRVCGRSVLHAAIGMMN